MAEDTPSSNSNQEREALDLNFELRRILSNSYNYVLGQQATQSFSAITYEELANEQIERIEGAGTPVRPNELERLTRIEREVVSLVEQVREIPPDQFILRDEAADVNTPPGRVRKSTASPRLVKQAGAPPGEGQRYGKDYPCHYLR